MRNYLIRRLIQSIVVILLVSLASFTLLNLLGDPFKELLMNPNVQQSTVAKLEHIYHWDMPFLARYFYWLKSFFLFQNGWGPSTTYLNETSLQLIAQRIGITLTLSSLVLLLSLLISIPLGIYSALHQYSSTDSFVTVLAFFGMSMPVFWTGIVFIYLFSIFPVIHLGGHAILPPGGMHSTFLRMGQNVIEFYKAPIVYQILNRAWCLVLPVIVLTLWNIGPWLRYQRSSMLEVIKQDYIRTARAKGLKERTIVYKHAFKNAIIPLITLLGLSLPGLIGGALITETVFGIDGIGRLTYNSVMGRDLFTSMSLIMVFSILVVIGNILADILYVIVDPRIKYQ